MSSYTSKLQPVTDSVALGKEVLLRMTFHLNNVIIDILERNPSA